MMDARRLKIGISACLMGLKYRYDGSSRFNREMMDLLADKVDLIPVCPEVECGLTIPRKTMHLEASARGLRIRVTETGEDVTDRMREWALNKLDKLEKLDIAAFICKANSPSCGLSVDVRSPKGTVLRKAEGIFITMLKQRFPGITLLEESAFPEAARYLYYERTKK